MRSGLSQRELAVLTWATKGYTDDMIAKELGIERGTVNSYWVRIRGKLGHLSRSELVARFVQAGADARHQEQEDAHQAELDANQIVADDLAAANKELLDRANAEIERLKDLLDKQNGAP